MAKKKWRGRKLGSCLAVAVLSAGLLGASGATTAAYADVQVLESAVTAVDGKRYWVRNHLVPDLATKSDGERKKWLLVWAGDENIADTVVKDVKNLPGTIAGGLNKVKNALPGPDFLAVIDATEGSPSYGKVVNTATVGPLVENEPHHMQYVWHKGDTVYAGRRLRPRGRGFARGLGAVRLGSHGDTPSKMCANGPDPGQASQHSTI